MAYFSQQQIKTKPHSRLSLIAVTLLLTFASQSSLPQTRPETQSVQTRAIGRKLQEKGVTNFGEVTPRLYRGGLVRRDGLKAIKSLGVSVIVDTHANDKQEEAEVKSLGMEYVAIPWHCSWPKDEVFAKFLKLLHDQPDKKVFVHCRLGDDRTGMMIAAYRMADEGWSADEAMHEMQSFGFSSSHHLLCPNLATYEKDFPRRLKSNPAFSSLQTKP
jgi:tyrosine-protein phosphatase SIW14